MVTEAKIKKRLAKIEKTKTATQHALPPVPDPLENFRQSYGTHYTENVETLMLHGKISKLEAQSLHKLLPNKDTQITPQQAPKLVTTFRNMLHKNPKMRENINLTRLRQYGTLNQIDQLFIHKNYNITEIEKILQDEGIH
jgi:hypothetical protein